MTIGQCTIGSSEHPCANEDELVIQVTGHAHSMQPQRLVFYKEDINQPTITRHDGLETVLEEYSYCPSSLFKWKIGKIQDHKLALQIDREDGGKINLPLLDYITVNNDFDDENDFKWNMLLAFIPLAIHKDINRPEVLPKLKAYATARPGYLYIFVENKLWREIEISQDKTHGWNLFRDTDLPGNRDEKGQLIEDQGCTYKQGVTGKAQLLERPVVGKAIKEVWIPFSFEEQEVDIKLVYCQSQIAAARLNKLEREGLDLTNYIQVTTIERFSSSKVRIDPLVTNGSSTTVPVWLDDLEPKRPRTDNEWYMQHPEKYLGDLTGSYVTKAYQATKEVDDACKGQAIPNKFIKKSDFDAASDRQFELDAWHNLLKAQYTEDKTIDPFWTQATPVKDVFTNAKERYILGIAILDPLYAVQHLKTELEQAQNVGLYTYLGLRAKQNTYYPTAKFINDMAQFAPSLKKGINSLTDEGIHRFKISIADYERNYLYERIGYWQEQLVNLLDTRTIHKALADLLSNQIPITYTSNLRMLVDTLRTLCKHPKAYDLLVSTIQTEPTKGQRFIYQLASDPFYPISLMLWPYTNLDKLKKPLQQPPKGKKGDNTGDGHWYAPAIQAVSKWDAKGQLPPELMENLVAKTMIAQAEEEKPFMARDLTRQELQTGMSAVYSILEELNGLVMTAQKAVAENAAHQEAKQQLQAEKELAEATTREKKQQIKDKQKQLNEYKKTTSMEARERLKTSMGVLNDAEQAMLNTQETLLQGSKTFRMNTFMSGVEQLREAVPDLFGDMHFVKYNSTIAKSTQYVVLGVATADEMKKLDILTHTPLSSGQIINKSTGEVLGTSSSKVAHDFYDALEELYLLAIPVNNKTNLLVENYAQSVKHYMQAMVEEMQAQGQVTYTGKVERLNRQELKQLIEEANHTSHHAAIAGSKLTKMMAKDYQLAKAETQALSAQGMANKLEPLLKTPLVSGLVLAIEAWNLKDTLSQRKSIEQKRVGFRADLGEFSAWFDVGLATVLFIEKFHNYGQTKFIESLKTVLDYKVKGAFFKALGLEGMAIRLLATTGSLVVSAGLSFWDTTYYLEQGNPAWKGYLMSGTGSSLLMAQGVMGEVSGALYLVSSSLFFVGFALLGFGIYFSIVLDNEDKIAEWFYRGPFSDPTVSNFVRDTINRTEGAYDYLQDNNQAIYRLLSILLDIKANITENPDKESARQQIAQLRAQHRVDYARIQMLEKISQADLKITTSANCAHFLDHYNVKQHIALFKVAHLTSNGVTAEFSREYKGALTQQDILLTQPSLAGNTYYVKRKSFAINTGFIASGYSFYEWEIRMQARGIGKADPQQLVRVYPAPPLEEQTLFDENKDAIVNFKDPNQRFWYKKILPNLTKV